MLIIWLLPVDAHFISLNFLNSKFGEMTKELSTLGHQGLNSIFENDKVKSGLQNLLGKKGELFKSTLLQIVTSDNSLQKCQSKTILNAAITAATLGLPINKELGRAFIVPYKDKAQLQIGWKGFYELALQSGQYKRINVITVYENQFHYFDTLTEELHADTRIEGNGKVAGYAVYLKMINGFEKTAFWSLEKVKAHALQYSQTYQKKSRYGGLMKSPWNDPAQFDAMAMKTVLKNTLSKYGLLSTEISTAIQADQSVQIEEGQFEYVDNSEYTEVKSLEKEEETKEREYTISCIDGAKNAGDLNKVMHLANRHGLNDLFNERLNSIKNGVEV